MVIAHTVFPELMRSTIGFSLDIASVFFSREYIKVSLVLFRITLVFKPTILSPKPAFA
jgi:hypothetical protein